MNERTIGTESPSCHLRLVLAVLWLTSLFISGLSLTAHATPQPANQQSPSAQARGLNNALLRLHAEMQQASSSEVAGLRRQAAVVIAQRAATLGRLIQADPHAALSFAFSPELLADLAAKFPDSARLLESHVTVTGPVERWTADYPGLKKSRSGIRMRASQQTLYLYFAGHEPAHVKRGEVVEATGVVQGYAMAVSSSIVAPSGALTSGTNLTSGCSNTGVQNTAVLLVSFPNATLPTGVTPQALSDTFFDTATGPSLNGFWQQASYGQASAAGSVFGPYTLTGSYGSCSDVGGAVLNDAIAAATAGGANLNNYSRVFLVFPDIFGCGWAGFASSSCSITSSSGTYNASMAYIAAAYATPRSQGASLAAHEGGHNMGLLHSGTISAGTDVLGPLSSPGTVREMGDYWSTMGATVLGLYPAAQTAEVLGWLPPSNYQVVQSSGTFTLQPLESASAGLEALKVQRGTGNNAWLWLEYRQPIGDYDSTLLPQPYSGALIHYEDSTMPLGQTYLPNFTPSDTTGFSPALAAGQTWTDPYSNLSLTVNSATATGLSVSVNYGGTTATCTPASPTITLTPLDPSIYPGSSASYGISVVNNDSSVCSSSTYTLGSTQPSGWPTSFSATSLSLSPGQSGTATMMITGPASTPPGTYAVNAVAASNSYSSTASANVTVMSPPSLTVSVSVSSSSYMRKSTVPITATVLNGGTPAAGASVTFTLITPTGSTITQSATVGSNGTATWKYKLSPRAATGTYSVSAQAILSGTGSSPTQPATSNTVTFSVQ